jgi:hypothetical protein
MNTCDPHDTLVTWHFIHAHSMVKRTEAQSALFKVQQLASDRPRSQLSLTQGLDLRCAILLSSELRMRIFFARENECV